MSKKKLTLNLVFAFIILVGLMLPLYTRLREISQLDENFFGKSELISLANNFRAFFVGDKLFHNVIIGEDGWLIHTSEKSVIDYQRFPLHTQAELDQMINVLVLIETRLAEKNIPLYIVIGPNKNTIYPEKVPAQLKVLGDQTTVEQFLSAAVGKLNAPIIYPYEKLLSSKQESQVYFATDTHWNKLGAFIVYQEIVKEIQKKFPTVVPLTLEDFEVTEEAYAGDMTRTAGGLMLSEMTPVLTPRFEQKADIDTVPSGTDVLFDAYVTTNHPDENLPTAFIYRDSFFSAVIPYLANHFHQSEIYWTYDYKLEPILELQPDLVMIELTERSLSRLLETEGILDD